MLLVCCDGCDGGDGYDGDGALSVILILYGVIRELTEDDYELLCSLDEPVNKGASKSQIKALPTREIKV